MSLADLFKVYPGFPSLLSLALLIPWTARSRQGGRLLLRGLGLVVAGTALIAILLAFLNLTVPDFIDNVEPTVVGDSWIWWHGGIMYPPVGDGPGVPELRGLLYGPLTFMLPGLVPTLFGGTILLAKIPAVLSFLGVIALIWFACRRLGAAPGIALAATAAMTDALGISDTPYWVRADAPLILIAGFCTWLVARPVRHVLLRSILLGLLAGAASGFKLHGAAYVAPACLLAVVDAASLISAVPTIDAPLRSEPWRLASREKVRWGRGLLSFLLIVLTAGATVAAPFALRGVNLEGYVFYLQRATHHGLSGPVFLGNITLVLSLCVPLLVLTWQLRAAGRRLSLRWLILSAAVFASTLLVAVIASKPGAGFPHLLPFIPYAGLLLCVVLAGQAKLGPSLRLLGAAALFCIACCVPVLARTAIFIVRRPDFAILAAGNRQVQDVLAHHPGETVTVGYGSGDFLDLRLSYLRILPVFAGSALPYDATAMDDLWKGGLDRELTLRAIDRCDVKVWLLPPGQPFTIHSFYGGSTFPETFRTLFAARYQKESSDGPFTVWVCRQPA